MKEIQRQMKHKQILEIAVCEKQNISGNYIEHDYVCIKLRKMANLNHLLEILIHMIIF